ncbi:MAG TPA: type I restriction-modification system subunit M N-terminal domain-containing protein [Chthoniobacterales bacterium]
MIWIAPSAKDTDNAALEKRLWDAADQFRANSGLKSQEYSAPVFGLIFLRFAEVRFAVQHARLEKGVHGLEGDILQGGNVNNYYGRPRVAIGHFDFAMVNATVALPRRF